MDIQQFRQQYPGYDDLSDVDLAKKLHTKNYSDMSFEEFAPKFGVQLVPPPPAPERPLDPTGMVEAHEAMDTRGMFPKAREPIPLWTPKGEGVPMSEEFEKAVTRGTARTGSGLLQTGAGFLSQMPAGPFGPRIAPEQVEKEKQQLRETADVLWKVTQDPDIAATNKDVASKAVGLIGETIPYITATTAGYFAGGPLGAFVPGAMVEGNSAWRNATDYFLEQNNGEPLTPEQEKQAEMIGVGVGLVSGAVEAFGGKGVETLANRAINKIQNKMAQRGAVFGIGMAIEALEEGAQETAAIVGEETYRDVSWGEIVSRVLSAMGGGLFLGGAGKSAAVAGRLIPGVAGRVQAGRVAAEAEGIRDITPTPIPESEITLSDFGTIEANNLPPVKKGDLRLYRGFSGEPREGGGTFYTPFLQHAFQYAKYRRSEYGGKGGLAYIDVPHDAANKFAATAVNEEYLGLENVALEYVFPHLAQPASAAAEAPEPTPKPTEAPASEPTVEPTAEPPTPKPKKLTRRKALKLGHKLPKKLGWNDDQRRDFNEQITGKRSMGDMKPAEMRTLVAAVQEQARDQGLLTPEDYPATIFIGAREVGTQEFIDEIVGTTAGLKNKAKKVKPMKARRKAKKGRGILGLAKDITVGIDNLSVPHLMRKIGGAGKGVIEEIGVTNWRRSIHHKSAVLRGGIDKLNEAIEKAGITDADLAKMSTSADPRLNLIKSFREFVGRPKTTSYKPMINGKQFDLSMDELMDMYLASLQDKGVEHIKSGGFEIRGYETGGIDEAGMEKLKAIVEADEKAMAVMNAVIDIADNYNAPQLNYTYGRLNPETMDLIADIKNYWHLEPKQVKKVRGKQTYGISFLENKNILRPRTGGKQPLVIRGLFPRFITVQAAVAEYVGMAEEMRLMNMIVNNEQVIKTLEDKGYAGVRDNLKSLLDWMVSKESNATSTDKLLSKIMRGSFRAVLHFSPEVVMAQYMSTIHYAGVVDPKYAKLLAVPPTPKLVKEMMEHNPVVWQRFYAGGQSAEMAEAGELDVTLRLLTGKHSDINKTGIAIQTTDLTAFTQGWKIAKAITKDSGLKETTLDGEPNPEFWDAVNDKAEELWDTQPSWDKWNKSNITRQRGIKRLPFLFRSYFEKSLMMLHSADATYEASEHTAADRAKQAQVYGAVISSQVLTALMRLFTGHFLWRDRKSAWDLIAAIATASSGMVAGVGGYLGMAVSNIIRVLGGEKRKWQGEPLSTLPGMIIAEGFEGSYEMSIAAADHLAGDEEKAEQGFKRGVKKLIKSVGTTKGLPVRQVDRIIKAIEKDEKKTKYGGGYLL